MMNVLEPIARSAKRSSYELSAMSSEDKNKILLAIADGIMSSSEEILAANKIDTDNLLRGDSAFLDRLTLNNDRLENMCEGLRQIAQLPDPVGEVVDSWVNHAGLEISKVRAPLGVIGVIYEARPNVTIDVAGLCIKTGNAVILRGGSDAINSNRALYHVIRRAIEGTGFSADIVQFIDDTDRARTIDMLKLSDYIDVIIPRGGDKLKKLVLSESSIPVIASAGGNCHIYVDSSADLDIAERVIINAKVQRPTVCNALEQLLIAEDILPVAVPRLFKALENAGVKIKSCDKCRQYYDTELAAEEDYYTEHHALEIAVKAVRGVLEAVEWINEHSTSHSEGIIATDQKAIDIFTAKVDSGCLYVNASTRFTDGFEFGFGAEIGISTQKLHARGPLGLKQLTSEKYVAVGNGTIRR